MLIGNPSIVDKSFSLAKAKNDQDLLLYQGKALQSRYDPGKEAQTWASKQEITSEVVLILGDPLGYAMESLQTLHPQKTILGISPFYQKNSHASSRFQNLWAPGDLSVREFLLSRLRDRQILGVQTLAWPRSTQLLGQQMRFWTDKLLTLAKERQNTLLQRKFFGQRMLRNVLKQDALPLSSYGLKRWNAPTLLLASGPTLEQHREILVANQEHFLIAALSSSLASLQSWGVKPDLILSMDPGFPSSIHLRYAPAQAPVLLPPTAYIQDSYQRFRLVPFSTGSLMEEHFFSVRDWKVPQVNSKGTVTLAAIDLLSHYNLGQSYVLGFDLAYSDLLSHCWPHSWSWKIHLESQRHCNTLSGLTELWSSDATLKLPGGVRTSPSLSSFGTYLNHSLDYHQSRIKLVAPLSFPHQAFETLHSDQLAEHRLQTSKKGLIKATELNQSIGSLRRSLQTIKEKEIPLLWRDYLCQEQFWDEGPAWRSEALNVLQKEMDHWSNSTIPEASRG